MLLPPCWTDSVGWDRERSDSRLSASDAATTGSLQSANIGEGHLRGHDPSPLERGVKRSTFTKSFQSDLRRRGPSEPFAQARLSAVWFRRNCSPAALARMCAACSMLTLDDVAATPPHIASRQLRKPHLRVTINRKMVCDVDREEYRGPPEISSRFQRCGK